MSQYQAVKEEIVRVAPVKFTRSSGFRHAAHRQPDALRLPPVLWQSESRRS